MPGFVSDQYADSSVIGSKIAALAILGSHLSQDAIDTAGPGVLATKKIGRWVQTAEQSNPNATTLDIKTLLGFGTTAGVDPEGTAKGKTALVEAAGGAEFNSTTGKVGGSAKARSSKVPIVDANGDGIVDANGDEVWAIITCSARTTGGSYTLRFFSGEFGSGAEAAYTMAQAFTFAYSQIYDLADMPLWDISVNLVDKEAAQLAPGQIGATELATDAVTQVKMANNSVGTAEMIDANVTEAKLALAVKTVRAELVLDDRTPTASQGKGFVDGSSTEGAVTAQGTPDMTVRVDAGGTAFNHRGERLPFSTSASLAITTADVTNARKDIVVVNAAGALAVRAGTPNASPVDPTLTAGDVPLARISVAANATTIGAGQIADLRERNNIDGTKLLAKTVGLAKFSATPEQQGFDGDNSATKFSLSNVVDTGWYKQVKVSRNGAQIEYNASPSGLGQYRVILEGGVTKVEMGAAVPSGQRLIVDYLY